MAAQSVASLAALSDFLDFSKEPTSLLETFLYAAAFSPRPSGELLRLVLVSTGISVRGPAQILTLCRPGGNSNCVCLEKENTLLQKYIFLLMAFFYVLLMRYW